MENVILGTMNILYPYSSSQLQINDYKVMIDSYLSETNASSAVLDTAYYYANGECERVLGEILPQLSYCPKISTKVNPWFENDFQNGKLGQLSREPLKKQLSTSLKNLRQEKVEYLFLHCHDYETPLEETLDACNTLWRQDKFNYLGISNFSFVELDNVIDICEKYGYVFPSYYQGMYNLICRKVERVLPYLHDNNIEFWAYNPLAGGLLSGKYNHYCFEDITCSSSLQQNRFKNNQIYQNIFWKPQIIEHLQKNFFELESNTCLDYSFHWLQFLSGMHKTDKIIMGASNLGQLQQNMKIIKSPKMYDIRTMGILKNIYHPISMFTPNYYY